MLMTMMLLLLLMMMIMTMMRMMMMVMMMMMMMMMVMMMMMMMIMMMMIMMMLSHQLISPETYPVVTNYHMLVRTTGPTHYRNPLGLIIDPVVFTSIVRLLLVSPPSCSNCITIVKILQTIAESKQED